MTATSLLFNLKSNMDRFIGLLRHKPCRNLYDLKSNMDRFIEGASQCQDSYTLRFKIQYG